MRFKQTKKGHWMPDDAANNVSTTQEQFADTIMSELRTVAADNGIDISGCETRNDIYEAFVSFGVANNDTPTDGNAPLDFEAMTVPQLKQYAADNGIDIMGATLKPDIVSVIAAAIKQSGE